MLGNLGNHLEMNYNFQVGQWLEIHNAQANFLEIALLL